MAKRVYRKGLELFHNETKQKIMFGKWNEDKTAACLSSKNEFLTLTKEALDSEYTSYVEIEKEAKERRRGQTW